MMKKFNYVYKTTCTVNNKYYIGMHSTNKLNDGYFGSGKIITQSLKKHGKENHTIEILKFCNSREEVEKAEEELITEEDLNNPDCMNLAPGGRCGNGKNFMGRILSEDHRTKISKALKGKPKPEEFVEKLKKRMVGKGPWDNMDEETKKRVKAEMSERMKKRTYSEETKMKMSTNRRNVSIAKSKHIIVDGVKYDTMKEAALILGISYQNVVRRAHNDNYPNYYLIEREA